MRLLKVEYQRRALLANVYPIEAVLNGAIFIHPNRGRESKVLVKLGRVEEVGKGVMPLASLVKRERIPPPAGRRVALGQQVLDNGAQVVGARVVVASLGGKGYFGHGEQTGFWG